jgi:hypothetical protein
MLNLYRYMVTSGMKKIEDVPSPYREMLEAEMAPAPQPEVTQEAPVVDQPADTTTETPVQ